MKKLNFWCKYGLHNWKDHLQMMWGKNKLTFDTTYEHRKCTKCDKIKKRYSQYLPWEYV